MVLMHEQIKSAVPNPHSPIKRSRRTGNNRAADGTEIRILHHTPIATRYPDGKVHTRTGGWNTRTTAKALNEVFRDWGLNTRARIRNSQIEFIDD